MPKKMLGEINHHVVAEEFAGQVFKQEPRQEEIDSVAPIVKHRDNESAADKRQGDESQAGHVAVDDVAGHFIGKNHREDEKTGREQGPTAQAYGERLREGSHVAA